MTRVIPNGVMVVEDDDDVREDLAALLEGRGYDVIRAANGREALDRLQQNGRPCIIVLDLMMPVMDGWTLRRELLRNPDLAEIPVVVVSGVDDPAAEARSLRAVDFVGKPVDLTKLYNVIATYC